MNHDEFIEEYLSICVAVFDSMRRSGQLDTLVDRLERTRTAKGLEINELSEAEIDG